MNEEDIWSDTTGEKYLYRYRPASVFTVHEVMFQGLYFQTRDKLNDLAEMKVEFRQFDDILISTEEKISILMQSLEERGHTVRDLRQQWIERFVSSPSEAKDELNNNFEIAFRKAEIEQRDQVEEILKGGVCCFSTKPLNPTMLAHYSNNDGVVLAFDREKMLSSLDVKDNAVFKVRYESEPIPIDLMSIILKGLHPEFEQAPSVDFVAMKHEDWKYESELRLVSMEKNGSFQSLGNGALAGLCFAPKSSETTREIFSKICSDNSIPVFECESINSYHYRAKLIVT